MTTAVDHAPAGFTVTVIGEEKDAFKITPAQVDLIVRRYRGEAEAADTSDRTVDFADISWDEEDPDYYIDDVSYTPDEVAGILAYGIVDMLMTFVRETLDERAADQPVGEDPA